jgi:hypothetical protein
MNPAPWDGNLIVDKSRSNGDNDCKLFYGCIPRTFDNRIQYYMNPLLNGYTQASLRNQEDAFLASENLQDIIDGITVIRDPNNPNNILES